MCPPPASIATIASRTAMIRAITNARSHGGKSMAAKPTGGGRTGETPCGRDFCLLISWTRVIRQGDSGEDRGV